MLVIWRIQRPERRGRRNRAAAQAAAAQAAQTQGTTTDSTGTAARPTDTMPGGLPLPVTAPRPSPPPEDDSPRSDMQALYGRFCKSYGLKCNCYMRRSTEQNLIIDHMFTRSILQIRLDAHNQPDYALQDCDQLNQGAEPDDFDLCHCSVLVLDPSDHP